LIGKCFHEIGDTQQWFGHGAELIGCRRPVTRPISRKAPASHRLHRGHRKAAARRENGSPAPVEQAGHNAGDRFEPGFAVRSSRRGIEGSRPCVYGMTRAGKQLADRSLLDDFSGIHHHDALRRLGEQPPSRE